MAISRLSTNPTVNPFQFAIVSATTGSVSTATYSSGGFSVTAYKFTGDGTITFSRPGTIDVFAVGGGGAAAGRTSGGGGAGGYLYVPNVYVPPTQLTCTVKVGAGGVFAGAGTYMSGNGDPSGLPQLGVIAYGGAGGTWGIANAANALSRGASGAGATAYYNPGIATTAYAIGQGNDGGSGGYVTNYAAGGGGGAGAAGGNGNVSTGVAGNGGVGLANTYADGVTSVYYAGGGGGFGNSTSGTGGLGGGGNGATTGSAQNGTANTGGGGGGAGIGQTAGAGGSGIVIIMVKS